LNLKNFQQTAYELTEKDQKPLYRYLAQIYAEAEADIRKQLDSIYARVLEGVKPEDYYNTVIKYDRLNSLLREVQKSYNYYYKQAGGTIEQLSSMAMNNTYYRQQYALHWIVPGDVGISFVMLDPRVVELSVTGTSEAWKAISESLAKKYLPANQLAPQYGTLSKLLYDNKIDDLKLISRTITQGFVQGYSNHKMAMSIRDIMTGSQGKEGVTMGKAMRVARTESARTSNKATQLAAVTTKNQGVNVMRMWIASLDSRTRPPHGRMDGKLAEVDGPFENGVIGPGEWPTVKDNVNERCTTGNVIVDENGEVIRPGARGGRNPVTGKPEYFEWQSFSEWAKNNGIKKNKYGEMYV